MEADKDGDGKLSFEEFSMMVANTVRNLSPRFSTASNPHSFSLGYRETNDFGGPFLSSQLSHCFRAACTYTFLELCSYFSYFLTICHGSMSLYIRADINDGEV